MAIAGIVKTWLAVKPIKTIRALRNKDVPEFVHEAEAEKDATVVAETGKGAWRHGLTAVGLLLVSGGVAQPEEVDGLVDSVMFFVTNWDQLVGAVMIVVGFGQSVIRKWRRRG